MTLASALPVPIELVGIDAGVGQVLDIGHGLQRERGHQRLDLVGAGIEGLDHHIADIVDDVGVVAAEADHRVEIGSAIEDIVVAGTGAADEQIVAEAAGELIVAGAADDDVVAGTAGDLVVGALLADDEVVDRRSGQIDRPVAIRW